jgi:hypothetical protein
LEIKAIKMTGAAVRALARETAITEENSRIVVEFQVGFTALRYAAKAIVR